MHRSRPESRVTNSCQPNLADDALLRSSSWQIDLSDTVACHQQLRELVASRPADALRLMEEADENLRRASVSFAGKKPLSTALSALLLSQDDQQVLSNITAVVHSITEKVLRWIVEQPDRVKRFFPDHIRMLGHLHPTLGFDPWQVISRYDAVVTPKGDIRIIELNTGCPAGFHHAVNFSQAAANQFSELGILPSESVTQFGTPDPNAMVETLLAIESASLIEPRGVAILVDENELNHELDLIEQTFRSHGRDARIIDARELQYDGKTLSHEGRAISLSYNKFRISVPTSDFYCWSTGFEQRYAAFLRAQADQAFVSANNLVGMSIGEDKSLLGLFTHPEIRDLLTADQRQFADEQIVWTSRLEDKTVEFDGQQIDLLNFVRENREQFVIKPSNEGRGYHVAIGRYCTTSEWEKFCTPDPVEPRVVQQYIEGVSLPVVHQRKGELQESAMFLTLGLAMIGGEYRGVLSRISASPITNVAHQGTVQGVLCR